jgi:uncharacterized phage protein (TIGR01671 family)
MREIEFRGKNDAGEWLYGYLTKPAGNPCFIIDGDDYFGGVIEETIGQYTGLTDKNATKIFEGDIVLTQEYSTRPFAKNAKRKRLVGVVEYYEQKHYGKNVIYNNGYRVKIKNQGKYVCGAWSDFYDCEVIGNIHDNPELLQGEEV